MGKELAFVLINPYTIRKSRTGGVIARYLARTDLRLVGARMFGASRALVDEYATHVRTADPACPDICALIADYVRDQYPPDPVTGRPHRCMCLLFEGEDAIRKIWEITGSVTLRWGSGQTVRDTYGDFITDTTGKVTYFEPAVLVGPTREQAYEALRIWLRYMATDSGIVNSALDVDSGAEVEQTLVLLKPDNFRVPSLRAGNIVDMLSSAGMRVVAIKKFGLTVAQAESFYGPVMEALERLFPKIGAARAAQAVAREFSLPVDEADAQTLCERLAPRFATRQFDEIIEFMTGFRPSTLSAEEKRTKSGEECLAIVYEGRNAVSKIRDLLGATDPTKARPGSVRREFGTNVMVNAAHASDSAESARRELEIVDMGRDPCFERYTREYCA